MIWLALTLLVLLAYFAARWYQRYREQRDLYISREQLHAWVIVPQAGSKERK